MRRKPPESESSNAASSRTSASASERGSEADPSAEARPTQTSARCERSRGESRSSREPPAMRWRWRASRAARIAGRSYEHTPIMLNMSTCAQTCLSVEQGARRASRPRSSFGAQGRVAGPRSN